MQTQTLNIALPKDLVKKVDEVAKKEYIITGDKELLELGSYQGIKI